MLLRSCSVLAALLIGSAMSAQTAKADSRRIADVAHILRDDAARVCNELYYHFRGSLQFDHIYGDAYEMYQLAGHIHDLAHERESLRHIRADVARLDELFHHFEDLLGEMDVGHGSRSGVHGFRGSASGYHMDRLTRLADSMSGNLHHLQEDIDPFVAPAAVPEVPLVPVGPAGRDRVGVRYDFGRNQIRFSF